LRCKSVRFTPVVFRLKKVSQKAMEVPKVRIIAPNGFV
jgi:hypothetical protein